MTGSPKKSEIIPAQRLNLIFELIRQKGVITIHELSDMTGVSLPTVRRDLDRLAKNGIVERSHGGATLKTPPGTTHEPDCHIASRIAIKEKMSIGKQAAERLRDNQSVIFDSSSTVYEAARQVLERGLTLTAVTNDLLIGELLANSPSIHLLVSGGSQRPGSNTLIGEPGTSFLRNLHVDVALIGIHAVNGSSCCDTSLEIAYAKRYMVAAAKRVIVLADASKFEKVAFFEAFEVNDGFEIITDRPLGPSVLHSLVDKGAKVTIAGE
jgi:DeoR family transcriptional regulator of aga operon